MRNDLAIAVHNIKADFKRLGKKQIKTAVIYQLKCFAVAMIIVAIVIIVCWPAFTTPTSKDSYEATKNQNWQQQVADYKK